MLKPSIVATLAAVALALATAQTCPAQDAPAAAQDGPAAGKDAPPAAPSDAGMKVNGSLDAGYRFTDVNGSSDSYRQLFDLSSGVRVFGIDMHGQAVGQNAFADSFSVTASGLGGDPFPSVQITAKKARVYDLRVTWRQSRLVDASPETPVSIAGFNTQAVTDHHSWVTNRDIGNISLTLHATNRLHFLVSYDRTARSGTVGSTESLDFLGSPSVWGAFARANPYAVQGPIAEDANRAAAGVSYSRSRWTVNYKLGYQTLSQTQTLDATASPETSINVADPTTAKEFVSLDSATQSRHLTAPLSELSFVARPSDRFEWRGEYLYSLYRGPFAFDGISGGTARTNTGGTAFSPFDLSTSARGDTREPSQVIGQGVTYRPFNLWTLDADYRYSRLTTETTGSLASLIALYTGATSPQGASEVDVMSWREAVQTLDLTTTFAPNSALTVRPGVRLMQRDVQAVNNGVVDPATSDRERSIWPELTVSYRPVPQVTARGVLRSSYADGSYTRMSPVQQTIAHGAVTLRPTDAFSIEANVDHTDADLYSAGFESHTRGASMIASLAMSDRFTISGGLDYRSFLGVGSVSFARGTAPITGVTMNDQEIDRIWQAGITLKPAPRFGVTATGNYDTTSGSDTILGEPPLYGPATFPYATASVYYDVPHAGRLSVDLQRTSWLQDLLPLNNFHANLVTIRYSRGF